MNAITATPPRLDTLFESAQRAHAVILLLTDACSDPVYGDAITYSLWAVEREIREIKAAIDAVSCDEPQEGLAQRETGGAA
ncbi:hypothetical protein [Methylomonas sp. 11b]|uniref:hypothetical protein n=1 Tax=Methylomonas sp. 11b TaxID=1168169 RepID=UPI00047E1A2C|nr:hypothetical protein [Methylomonas sp. 11b]